MPWGRILVSQALPSFADISRSGSEKSMELSDSNPYFLDCFLSEPLFILKERGHHTGLPYLFLWEL